MSIIKHVTLQKIVAHDFRYDPRRNLGVKFIKRISVICRQSVNDLHTVMRLRQSGVTPHSPYVFKARYTMKNTHRDDFRI